MPRELYRVDFFVSASLDYTGKDTAPRSDEEVATIAKLASPTLQNIIEDLTAESASVRVVYARRGSAEIGFRGRSLYESYDDWIRAKDMLVDLVVMTEEWFAAELRIQEGLERERVSVRAQFFPPAARETDNSESVAPTPTPTPAIAPEAPLADLVQQQFRRIIAVLSIACFLSLLFGVVLTGAVFAYSALREEVSLLRQEIATRAAPSVAPASQQPIIVSAPPAQVTVITQEPSRSRVYRSGAD